MIGHGRHDSEHLPPRRTHRRTHFAGRKSLNEAPVGGLARLAAHGPRTRRAPQLAEHMRDRAQRTRRRRRLGRIRRRSGLDEGGEPRAQQAQGLVCDAGAGHSLVGRELRERTRVAVTLHGAGIGPEGHGRQPGLEDPSPG